MNLYHVMVDSSHNLKCIIVNVGDIYFTFFVKSLQCQQFVTDRGKAVNLEKVT